MCVQSFDTETDIDLSKMRMVSNGMLSTDNPFTVNQSLDNMKFRREVIKVNAEKFIGRSNCGKNKKKKMANHCPKCIFQCDSKLITTDNVDNKCCLTYEQALKNGFFKDLKFLNSTSIYNGEVLLRDGNDYSRLFSWGKKIALNENKYQK